MHDEGWTIQPNQLSSDKILSLELPTTCGEEHSPLCICHGIIIYARNARDQMPRSRTKNDGNEIIQFALTNAPIAHIVDPIGNEQGEIPRPENPQEGNMAKKAAKAVEPEDDDVELEEMDEEVEDEAPAKGKAKKADDDIWGVQSLIKLIKQKTGKDYTPREVRTLLRKMARDGKGRVEREIVAGNKSRYSWSGPDDPEVKRILKAVTGGEIEAGKKEALDKLKEQKAAKAAAKADAPPAKKGKKKAAPPPDDDDDDLEEIEDDDDE
jgi:translation elongation factor EF-1beta